MQVNVNDILASLAVIDILSTRAQDSNSESSNVIAVGTEPIGVSNLIEFDLRGFIISGGRLVSFAIAICGTGKSESEF